MDKDLKAKLSKELKDEGYKIIKHNNECTVLKKGADIIKLK